PTDPDQDQDRRTFVGAFAPGGAYQRSWHFMAEGDPVAIAIAPDDTIHVAATFSTVVDFDPGPNKTERTPGRDADGQYRPAGYVVKFGNDGSFRWVQAFQDLAITSIAARND